MANNMIPAVIKEGSKSGTTNSWGFYDSYISTTGTNMLNVHSPDGPCLAWPYNGTWWFALIDVGTFKLRPNTTTTFTYYYH